MPGRNDPLSDVVIRENTIATHNNSSHGIYMGNAVADSGGSASTFFRNITIDNNTIVSGQVSGIAVGQTIGLSITDNTILQDTHFRSTQEINIPVIRVHADSTDVSITGNITHRQPEPNGNNWFPTDKPEPGWIMANNTIVPLGTTPDNPPDPPDPTDPGNGRPDLFRFDNAGPADVVSVDFSEGDVIELFGYKGGAFHAQSGGNELIVTVNGAVLDSLADLRELDTASAAVTIRRGQQRHPGDGHRRSRPGSIPFRCWTSRTSTWPDADANTSPGRLWKYPAVRDRACGRRCRSGRRYLGRPRGRRGSGCGCGLVGHVSAIELGRRLQAFLCAFQCKEDGCGVILVMHKMRLRHLDGDRVFSHAKEAANVEDHGPYAPVLGFQYVAILCLSGPASPRGDANQSEVR